MGFESDAVRYNWGYFLDYCWHHDHNSKTLKIRQCLNRVPKAREEGQALGFEVKATLETV